MTSEVTVDTAQTPVIERPSTAGMTTKVVKGSAWTLAGSVLPLAVSFFATPFVIRFLGSEAYGVLLLVGLIPTYFSFADFGMGVASTKFAAEAYGDGDGKEEAEVVWTAAAIAAISALIVAIPLFVFSYPIVRAMNVPEHLLSAASVALKITSGSFFLGVLSSVLNSPMLARLRMDLNTVTQAAPKVLLAAITPLILYLGGGIVGVVAWWLIVAVFTLAVVVYFSGHLQPRLFNAFWGRALVRPLIKFGGGWFIAALAAMLLVNLEKLFLTKMVSVKALAYYSVAFTFANMAAIFSQAMGQSLVPAFSQIQSPERRSELKELFSRSIRLNIILVLPAIMVMFVVAEPFLTLWAGEEFGRESTYPLYILLAGLIFNLLAYVPHASIMAAGRTEVLAKLYWCELAVYVLSAWVFIGYFGIIGAAIAWSFRVIVDALLMIALSKRVAGVQFHFTDHFGVLGTAAAFLLVPCVLSSFTRSIAVLAISAAAAIFIYAYLIWNRFVNASERLWIRQQIGLVLSGSK